MPGDELYSDDLADLCQEWQSFCAVKEDRKESLRRGSMFGGYKRYKDMDGHARNHKVSTLHCGASTQSSCFVFGSSCYHLGCTVAAVSAQWPVEHVNNYLLNITTEWTPYSVESNLLTLDKYNSNLTPVFLSPLESYTVMSHMKWRETKQHLI